jgi:hypothetical protein
MRGGKKCYEKKNISARAEEVNDNNSLPAGGARAVVHIHMTLTALGRAMQGMFITIEPPASKWDKQGLSPILTWTPTYSLASCCD